MARSSTKVLVTGSSGLVGSEVVRLWAARGAEVTALDNNARRDFFGDDGDTTWNERLLPVCGYGLDIRNRDGLVTLFDDVGPFDLIVHCAAQPSHDLSARRPLDDFDTNAVGTVNLLEAARQHSPEAIFVHLSTSKVYGDAPNELMLVERETRYDVPGSAGIDETMRIDASLHSPFGASKASADLMVQEYGRYFGLRTTCLRPGCLTGRWHSGVELHGFLSYLAKCVVTGTPYKIFGYKGKQVRDNLDGYDVATATEAIFAAPPTPGAAFNLGGGRGNAISILEALARVGHLAGKQAISEYVPEARRGDHIWYVSDTSKFQAAYPAWRVTKNLDVILQEIVETWRTRLALA